MRCWRGLVWVRVEPAAVWDGEGARVNVGCVGSGVAMGESAPYEAAGLLIGYIPRITCHGTCCSRRKGQAQT